MDLVTRRLDPLDPADPIDGLRTGSLNDTPRSFISFDHDFARFEGVDWQLPPT